MSEGICSSWLHVGDLHARAADGWTGVARLRATLDDCAAVARARETDFIYLPGDNANEGEPEQYARIREAIASAPPAIPIRVVPGDHDFEPGNLDAYAAFVRSIGSDLAPASVEAKGRRLLFLDMVSAGAGGPGFAIGERQRAWLGKQLIEAGNDDRFGPVAFMHGFPYDLAIGAEELEATFARGGVTLVDTGHTHYNEIINDGTVIYTAVRSTAQIEEEHEAAFGAAFVAVDGDDVSFKFRNTGSGWPFVMITSPADHRLRTRRPALDADGRLTVRAKVFGAGDDVRVTLHAFDRSIPMQRVEGERALWSATLREPWDETIAALAPPDRRTSLTVRAQSDAGDASDTISLRPKTGVPPGGPAGARGGAIGAWVEHGVLGTRLGPNAYGRDW